MKSVVFLRSARNDLRSEFSYYAGIDLQLALRFAQSVELTARLIATNPEAMQVLRAEIRRWPVRGFPHGVLYRLELDRVVVLAVFHPKQDPAKWIRRVER